MFFAVEGWCLFIYKGLKGQPRDVENAERPRPRNHYPRAQRLYQTGVLLINYHPNHLQDYLRPWGQTALGDCRC